MQFAIYCKDKEGGLELRKANRPEHIDYLSAHGDQLVYAGPLLAGDNETPIGSLLVFEGPDLNSAQTFAKSDPYARAGLFQSVDIHPVKQVFPKA